MELFRSRGVPFHTTEAMKAGVHPRTLYAMRDQGIIRTSAQGVYRLTDTPALSNPDLAIVATKIPKGVICLISALSFHGITNEIPHQIYLALPRGSETPRLDYPPLKIFRFGDHVFTEGIEHHKIDGISIKVYSSEKTITDCFKYRNKIGIDVVMEALKLYRQRKSFKVNELIRYAKVSRVEKIMRPYIEAVL